MLINLHAASPGTIFLRHSLPVNSRYNSWRCLPLGRYNTRSIRKLPVLRRRRLPAKPLCTVAAMNLSTNDSSSTNNIAIIFDCLYRFLKYSTSPSQICRRFLCGVCSIRPSRCSLQRVAGPRRPRSAEGYLIIVVQVRAVRNPSPSVAGGMKRSETLLDDGVERRVVRRKRHAPVDLDF